MEEGERKGPRKERGGQRALGSTDIGLKVMVMMIQRFTFFGDGFGADA
jgi:hypothetical protein